MFDSYILPASLEFILLLQAWYGTLGQREGEEEKVGGEREVPPVHFNPKGRHKNQASCSTVSFH